MSLIMRDGVPYGAAPTSAGYILPGDNNGEIKVVPEGATPYNVKVKGWDTKSDGILYSFSAIGNVLQLGKITGTIFGYIDILTHVTSSTVGDTHEAYLFSLNVDEFISSSGTTPDTEYPVESAQLIHTGQESGLIFVAYYDQSNNIYLKPVSTPGHEQTMTHISLYLSNPHVVTV